MIVFSGVLPTGYGKSLIFESLPYFQSTRSIILVTSPLNSIIEEQLERYPDAIQFNDQLLSDLDHKNESSDVVKFSSSNFSYVIGHPEPFNAKKGFRHLKLSKLCVVDEAHCIVQWGEGFRELKMLRSIFPSANMLALTATTTKTMREEIALHLAMKDYEVVPAPVDRANIKIMASQRVPKLEEIDVFLGGDFQSTH